ncbi:MAG TPA: hypothetical protein VLN45_09375, partial [Ignavibacteriaceae bacterium]|nr:hypothetical protein [Ignavibacteriaceae bacterium]
MKFYTKFLLVLMLGLQVNSFPQIPNGHFEVWVDDNTPEGWFTNNAPTLWITVTKTVTAFTGSFGAELRTADYMGNAVLPFMETLPFPVDQAYGSVVGYYQFNPAAASEVLGITAWFLENGALVGFGYLDIATPAANYTMFEVPINYSGDAAAIPDTAFIWVAIYDTSGNDPVVGAVANVDNFYFGPPASVNEISSEIPENFGLSQNYPNPFNPSTKINFSITEQTIVEIIVYDILGNEISTLVNDNYSAG